MPSKEIRDYWYWYIGLLVPAVVGFVLLGQMTEWDQAWTAKRKLALVVALAGVPSAQLATSALRAAVARLSEVKDVPGGAKNRWPQRFLGLVETVSYAVAFASVDQEKVLAGAGAWIALKQFGKWPRWERSDPASKPAPSDDEKRRRFYVFLFANALQVAGGAIVGHALRWALR